MKKNVQISFELFQMLLCYFLMNDNELEEPIVQELENKLQKLIAQEYFARYKTAQNSTEREIARQLYLEHIQMKKSFRTETETSYTDM